jgi:hypothetical protein
MLVQITRRKGCIERVRPGVTPIIELDLEPHQRVVSVELSEYLFGGRERKTTDWYWTAFVATYLGEEA